MLKYAANFNNLFLPNADFNVSSQFHVDSSGEDTPM